MATLTPLNAAFQLDASDNFYLFFTADTTQTQSRALDDVDEHFLSMDNLSWAVEYAQENRVDDTLELKIRIVNGATILAAANAGGDFQTVNANVTNTTDQVTGPTPFFYVNTTADKATWNGASVELEQVFTAAMMADGCRIRVDWVEFTGEYTPSVQTFEVLHTTNVSVGTFAEHTTDILVSEFSVPVDTRPPPSALTGHSTGKKAAFSEDGQLWMVGVESGTSSPTTIRLWQGSQPGPGLWQLHVFDHGSGNNRDVSLAILGDKVHITYINHTSSTQRGRHIVWDMTEESWTDNGVFGIGESHSDPLASQNARCDLVVTPDNELAVLTVLYNYVSFGGSTAFRVRARIFKSTNQILPTSGGILVGEWYGPNIFDRPTFAGPALRELPNTTLVHWAAVWYAFYDDDTLSPFYPNPGDSPSTPILPMNSGGGTMRLDDLHEIFDKDGRHIVPVSHGSLRGYVAANDENGDELLFDQGEILIDTDGLPTTTHLVTDHYNRLALFLYSTFTDTLAVLTSNGIDQWFVNSYEADLSTGNQPWLRIEQQMVSRTLASWFSTSSGEWTWTGYTVPTWHLGHTTDLVVNNGQVVNHSTDILISSGMWGRPDTEVLNSRKAWFEYDNDHYIVTINQNRSWIHVFRAATPQNPGALLTQWKYADFASNPVGTVTHDWVHVNGTIHFLILFWVNNRREAHHSEYDLDTETWTHHGSFHNGATAHHQTGGPTNIALRGNGDLVALYQFGNPGGGLHYSLNTGTGFGAGTSLERTTGFSTAGIAVDGNDVHFLGYEASNLRHWHLDPSNVLGARQDVSSSPQNGYQTTKPLVHNNTMFILNNTQVHHAPTGSDAPTWTTDSITSRSIAKSALLVGPDGLPTVIFIEQSTWKIWKVRYDGSWIESDTGLKLPATSDDTFTTSSIYASDVDSSGYAYFWSGRRNAATGTARWYPYRVNLNPLVVHTTDVITVEGSQVVVHTTNVLASITVERTHTTDVRVAEGAGEVAIEHTTDVRATARLDVAHTTDVYAVLLLTHTTDIVIAPKAHEISATILLSFEMTVTLEQGNKPAATGLGIPRQGRQAPRIYNPKRKVVKR